MTKKSIKTLQKEQREREKEKKKQGYVYVKTGTRSTVLKKINDIEVDYEEVKK